MKGRARQNMRRWAQAVESLALGYRVKLWGRHGVNPRGYVTAPDGEPVGFAATHGGGDMIFRNIREPHRTALRQALASAGRTIPRLGERPVAPTEADDGR